MTVGTKSVFFGAHCFFLHPWFVLAGWIKLFGFPFDPRIWVAFFVHDLGYIGLENMDGPEGVKHPELGASIMSWFDDEYANCPKCFDYPAARAGDWPVCPKCRLKRTRWHDFALYHSRYYAKANSAKPSKLCFADKLSFCYTPRWLYLPMVTATGEINEYLKNTQSADSGHWTPTGFDKKKWHGQLKQYMRDWVFAHVGGADDTWTSANRHADERGG